MTNVQAYKTGYRDACRVAKVAKRWESYVVHDLTAVAVVSKRPSMSGHTEAYRNGWTDGVQGDDVANQSHR